MLTLLKIENLALVDQLTWTLGEGLIGVTGETGAGKSVIVGALKLILGERADKGLIRTGEDSCTVQAVFELSDTAAIDRILAEGGLPPCEETQIIIRRSIATTSNRQFVNDAPVTLSLLKRIGENLVDLHGPHEHQSLFSQERQLALLDAFAGKGEHLSTYRHQYNEWRTLATELNHLENAENASESQLELLTHQLGEIEAANLSADDGEELQDRYIRSSNSSRLAELTSTALAVFTSEDGIFDKIAELQRLAHNLEKLDPTLADFSASVETAALEIQDLEASLTDYADDLELDPASAQVIEERVTLVETLKRKYGPSLEDIFSRQVELTARLDLIENRSGNLEILHEKLKAARTTLNTSARKLSLERKRSAPKLAAEISSQLKQLGFKQSSFEIELKPHDAPTAHGMESCNFLFGPNPGEPLQPLRQIGSSGEISRVMLAVKSSIAEQDSTPLMVFDEIDANVGGEIAKAVGQKMARLGKSHQVIAITHFPQVAATADHHFVVEKEILAGRTRSILYPVEGEGRIKELVRMLGGGGTQATAMAKSLLQQD